ncbi:MAG: hypothetical protein NTU53_06130, partial [Planctomycetota bacterium]|nr:hypothetical protein [Planctomycetota bacterium]
MEITTQRIAFGPDPIGLGFIRVKGFTIEQVGNAFPMQEEGAISTRRGHHWIIEDNTIRQANGVGIDVGSQFGGSRPGDQVQRMGGDGGGYPCAGQSACRGNQGTEKRSPTRCANQRFHVIAAA